MKHIPLSFLLLAERNRLEYLTRGFRKRPTDIDFGDVMLGVGIAVGFLVALWLLSVVVERRQHRGPYNSRLWLFLSLCRAHELAWSQWWLLWRVARYQRLRDPGRLFLEPERLNPAGLAAAFGPQIEELESLQRRLFEGLPQQNPQADDGRPDQEEHAQASKQPSAADSASQRPQAAPPSP